MRVPDNDTTYCASGSDSGSLLHFVQPLRSVRSLNNHCRYNSRSRSHSHYSNCPSTTDLSECLKQQPRPDYSARLASVAVSVLEWVSELVLVSALESELASVLALESASVLGLGYHHTSGIGKNRFAYAS